MDEWKDLDEELKELEDSLIPEDDILRHLVTPSAADYWKKRIDEEKSQFSKILESKDGDNKLLEDELKSSKSQIHELSRKIRELEEYVKNEAFSWEQKVKTKEFELNIEKERIDFNDRIKELEKENHFLQEELVSLKRQLELEKSNLEAKYRVDLQDMLSKQRDVVRSLEFLDGQAKSLSAAINKKDSEIEVQKAENNNLVRENETALNEVKRVAALLEYQKAGSVRYRDEVFEYFYLSTRFFSEKIRRYLGTLLGIASVCSMKIRGSFLSKNRIVKKQIGMVDLTVTNALVFLEKTLSIFDRRATNPEEISVEKLMGMLGLHTDTSRISPGLNIKLDVNCFVEVVKKYSDKASFVSAGFEETEGMGCILLKIVPAERVIRPEDILELKNIVYIHGWTMKIDKFENHDELVITIQTGG